MKEWSEMKKGEERGRRSAVYGRKAAMTFLTTVDKRTVD